MMKSILRGGIVATSREAARADILIEGGRIAAVGEIPPDASARTIDASGKYILPGGVDAHTHFDLDVGFDRASDDFLSGTIAAAIGGTTTAIDHMAFGPAGASLRSRVREYHRLAAPAVIDYGFHGVVQRVDAGILAEMEELMGEEGIQSYKAYMTYDGMLSDRELLAVLQRAKQLGLVICAHCENDGAIALLREEARARGDLSIRNHPLTRPDACEAEAVYRFLSLAHLAGDPHAYVVHVSSGRGLRALLSARAEGQQNIHAETCPQYLLLEDSLYDDPAEGLKYAMSPPLRKAADRAALWEGLASGAIEAVATDHCPFFFATQKQRGREDFTLTPMGAPGVELRMSLLFFEGFVKGRMPLPAVVRACCTRPAEIFGLAGRKGDIAPGFDADIVLIDPDATWTARAERLHEHVDYTPYEGMKITGLPVMTISRGDVIVENGRFLGEPGRGTYLRRAPLMP